MGTRKERFVPRMSSSSRVFSWHEVERLARSLPEKTNLVVPKTVTGTPPPYAESRLGRRRGALRQFRDDRRHKTVHVKEYEDRWVVHVDAWNPHRHVLRHLLVDHGYSVFVHFAHALEAAGDAMLAPPAPAPVSA